MDIKKKLLDKGFVFIPKWQPSTKIDSLAEQLGSVIKISDYEDHSGIPDVQKIIPKQRSKSLKNQYSGKFGLDSFPLHTDLAHWSKPPNYLMLRCIRGFEQVSTKVLPLKYILPQIIELGFARSVVKPKNNERAVRGCLLPLSFQNNNQKCIRWDSLFLEAANDKAELIQKFILKDEVWDMAINIRLVHQGDTLIINNHSHLHARSSIPTDCVKRELERIYFN
ncbi:MULTISPECIES: TauD/TfdA family dioxygenase [unclassified Pseudoalteromonas]|uniref:TauD/TfdA family dioxygenase n=1 Tax=unclassified Pseudoalteromonas TaxID=194690 RepID=UPI0015FFED7A|nr:MULTISPECIES: TauD/TfdA family dioxygenase [unclassified Pseudoalteromonas]MBB1333138.1 TauD/TfdA family dioxygenase [Pseudoalteromonas sp. SR41-6]MBB1458009.1 TauD/TfdA family dioxygenase [Pseudoalteromonas sp. SG41-8]